MAWTTPATFTTGNTLTAAQLNTNLRDNTNYLHDPPMVMAQRSGAQSIANNTETTVQYSGTDLFDTDTMHDPVTNNTRITVQTPGVYLFWASGSFVANATGIRYAALALNGTATRIAESGNLGSGPGASIVAKTNVTGVWKASAADFVELIVYQNSGGALNFIGPAGGDPAYFGAQWMGAG